MDQWIDDANDARITGARAGYCYVCCGCHQKLGVPFWELGTDLRGNAYSPGTSPATYCQACAVGIRHAPPYPGQAPSSGPMPQPTCDCCDQVKPLVAEKRDDLWFMCGSCEKMVVDEHSRIVGSTDFGWKERPMGGHIQRRPADKDPWNKAFEVVRGRVRYPQVKQTAPAKDDIEARLWAFFTEPADPLNCKCGIRRSKCDYHRDLLPGGKKKSGFMPTGWSIARTISAYYDLNGIAKPGSTYELVGPNGDRKVYSYDGQDLPTGRGLWSEVT